MKFGNGQQDITTYQTSRARQMRLQDNSSNAPKLPSILPHININTINYLWQMLKNNRINILKRTFTTG